MKKLLLVLVCGALFAGGCNFKRGSTQMQEILDTVTSLGVDKDEFLENAGYYTDDGTVVVRDYFPTSGRNRVVLAFLDTDGDDTTSYVGLDLTGYNQVLKDMEGMEDAAKVTALQGFVENAFVDDLSPVGNLYYQNESGELFSEKTQRSKDLEALGAKAQLSNSKEFANKLSAEYGLSEQRATKVAKLVSQYNNLSSKRSLSNREQNYFSRELLGVDYNQALEAMTKTQDERSQLLEKAAKVNGTSSEQVSSIINELFL